MTVQELIQEALKLSEAERQLLVERISQPTRLTKPRKLHEMIGLWSSGRSAQQIAEDLNQQRAEWDEREQQWQRNNG